MKCVWTALIPAVVISLSSHLPGQTTHEPSDTLLAGVTARGRLLAAYDRAAWHGTDAFFALKPALTDANSMLARQQPDGHWIVDFGRLTAARDTLYLVYEAVEAGRPDSFTARKLDPPTPVLGDERLAAVALHTSLDDFGTQQRAYNSYVLPRDDRKFWVFFLPAPTNQLLYPLGADVRFLISADGRQILEKHPMHHALLNMALPDSALYGLNTVLVDDVPQESDVFLTLTRTPHRPELVATAHYDYEIAVDGSITWRVGQRDKKDK